MPTRSARLVQSKGIALAVSEERMQVTQSAPQPQKLSFVAPSSLPNGDLRATASSGASVGLFQSASVLLVEHLAWG